jgi:hypothetical protein
LVGGSDERWDVHQRCRDRSGPARERLALYRRTRSKWTSTEVFSVELPFRTGEGLVLESEDLLICPSQ